MKHACFVIALLFLVETAYPADIVARYFNKCITKNAQNDDIWDGESYGQCVLLNNGKVFITTEHKRPFQIEFPALSRVKFKEFTDALKKEQISLKIIYQGNLFVTYATSEAPSMIAYRGLNQYSLIEKQSKLFNLLKTMCKVKACNMDHGS